MIAALSGTIIRISTDSCVLDVQGVGYNVSVGIRLARGLSLSQKSTFWIESIVHESQITLFGFIDPFEQDWFTSLIKISGISGRLAQKILSSCPPSSLVQAILKKDVALLKKTEGVGEKLAQRLIIELKDKAYKMPLVDQACSFHQDVIQGLLSLGYRPHEAQNAVQSALCQDPTSSPEALLTACLQLLSGN